LTKRNIDLLSNRDMFVKYANVVEVTRNAKISIYHKGGLNCVQYMGIDKDEKNSFRIFSATPNVKGIEKFVGIIHELSHILFQSPFNGTKKLLSDVWGLKDEDYQLFFNVFNVLEDQRIESQMGKMYLKHKGRFDKTTKKLGTLMDLKNPSIMHDNPVNMLLAIRFHRGNDIKNLKNYDVYEKALKQVVFTDKYGALKVLVSLKPYIDEWIEEKENNMYSAERNNHEDKKFKLDKDSDITNKLFRNNAIRSNGQKDEDMPQELSDENISKNKIKDMIKDSKERGNEVVSEIFSKLRNDGKMTKLPKMLKMVKRYSETVEVDEKVLKGLTKIFKKLTMKESEFIDYEGDEIDVQEYVESLIRGNNMGECRINTKQSKGVSILISIDGSSSMVGERIYQARKMVATMFRSVKNLDNVDIKANVWSGASSGMVGITEINNESDLGYISASVLEKGFYTTPIHMAIDHSAKTIKHMKGNKKMIVFITDGVPNHFNAGYHISMEKYIVSCKKSMKKARETGSNMMCVVISSKQSYRYNPVRQLFKPNQTMNFFRMSEGSERIIKEFKLMVVKSLV